MLDIYNRNDLDSMSWYEHSAWWKVDIPYMIKDYQTSWMDV